MADDRRDAMKPGPVGCLLLLVFFVLEVVAGFAVGALFFPLPFKLLIAVIPASERDFAGVCATVLSFAPAFAAAWGIDRLCRRLTGHSVIDNLPYIP